jgi:hypothetical protein
MVTRFRRKDKRASESTLMACHLSIVLKGE